MAESTMPHLVKAKEEKPAEVCVETLKIWHHWRTIDLCIIINLNTTLMRTVLSFRWLPKNRNSKRSFPVVVSQLQPIFYRKEFRKGYKAYYSTIIYKFAGEVLKIVSYSSKVLILNISWLTTMDNFGCLIALFIKLNLAKIAARVNLNTMCKLEKIMFFYIWSIRNRLSRDLFGSFYYLG